MSYGAKGKKNQTKFWMYLPLEYWVCYSDIDLCVILFIYIYDVLYLLSNAHLNMTETEY